MLNEALQTFIQVVRVPAYSSTIISAAADEGPDEMMCFPAGLHYLLTFPSKNVQNITEIDMSLCVLFRERMSLYRNICELFRERMSLYRHICEIFRERMSLYRHICELFQKGEGMDR